MALRSRGSRDDRHASLLPNRLSFTLDDRDPSVARIGLASVYRAPKMTELYSAPGPHGTVRVVDTQKSRKLIVGAMVQGGCFLEPSATSIYSDAPSGPGPVFELGYQVAWLAAGRRHPEGYGLMLGLGCGAGVVALLHHFPGLHVDAVEIDPMMASLAREYFPLVRYFERQGRLGIIVEDAMGFLTSTSRTYDFVLADIATDSRQDGTPSSSSPFVERILAVTSEVWFNAISSLDFPALHRLLGRFDECDSPVKMLMSTERISAWLPIRRNWILSTADIDMDDLRALTPYPEVDGDNVSMVRHAYRELLANSLTRSQAREYAERQRIKI